MKLLATLPDNSVDFFLSDPPYFLDQLDDAWSRKSINKKMSKAGAIGGLPRYAWQLRARCWDEAG